MPWYIRDILVYEGTVTIENIGEEVTVIELSNMSDYYMIVGFINLGSMSRGDELYVTEYIDLGSGVYDRYISARFSNEQRDPLVLITPKYFTSNDRYKLTVKQTSGVPLTISYKILVFIYEQTT